MEHNDSQYFALNCMSTGSPPTNVTWLKDGIKISQNYFTTQRLVDASSSTYSNVLLLLGEPVSIMGTHTCIIENTISAQAEAIIAFEGKILNFRKFNNSKKFSFQEFPKVILHLIWEKQQTYLASVISLSTSLRFCTKMKF